MDQFFASERARERAEFLAAEARRAGSRDRRVPRRRRRRWRVAIGTRLVAVGGRLLRT